MRILVVQESDWVERGPHQQHHLIERLQRRGHEVRVIDYEVDWRKKPHDSVISRRLEFLCEAKTCKGPRIRVIRPRIVKMPLLNYVSIPITYGVEICKQIREFNPNVTVGLGILDTYLAMRICKRFGVPFVYYLIDAVHTLIPESAFRSIGKVIEKRTLRNSDAILVINRQLKRYSIEMGADPKKVVVIGAGIDTSMLNPRVDGREIRRKYGIGEDEIVLFFMGWLYDFSGIREVAYSLLKSGNGQKVRLLVLGKGDIYEELLALKKDKLGDKLVLVDWQPYNKVPQYIAASDICLLPARLNEVMRDIVPIKMYEYMACGKPVITTKLPGVMREFGEGHGIIYVDNPNQVWDQTVKLSRNRTRLKGLGLKAADYVKKYSWDNITTRFEEILEDL